MYDIEADERGVSVWQELSYLVSKLDEDYRNWVVKT